MYTRERSQSVMSEFTVQCFRKTIKLPVQSAILCCALIKDKHSHETPNHAKPYSLPLSQSMAFTCVRAHKHALVNHANACARSLMREIVQSACSGFQQCPLRTLNTHLSVIQPAEIRIVSLSYGHTGFNPVCFSVYNHRIVHTEPVVPFLFAILPKGHCRLTKDYHAEIQFPKWVWVKRNKMWKFM